MATIVERKTDQTTADPQPQSTRSVPVTAPANSTWGSVQRVLKPLASLQLTVALFAMSIVIVLAGTLAQVNADIWDVIQEYFRVDFTALWMASFPWINLGQLFVWIDAELFFPPSFFPPEPTFPAGFGWMVHVWPQGTPDFPNWVGLWFPKGWTIGAVMMLNLFAAHTVRFKVQSSGMRLWAGWGVIAFGCLITLLVIMSGSNTDGVAANSILNYDNLWILMQVSLLAFSGLLIYAALSTPAERWTQRWLWGGLAALFIATFAATFGMSRFDDSAMRILFQLMKGTLAGVVLLVGCVMVFNKRAGIVLLHGGIGLIMVYDVIVGVKHVEGQMRIAEGQTVQFARDIREIEFAIVDGSDDETDTVTIIPGSFLREGKTIEHELLPFDVRVDKFFRNSDLKPVQAAEEVENPATAGLGTRFVATDVRAATGTDTAGMVDVASAYVTLLDKRSGEEIDTYLVTSFPDAVPGALPETQSVQLGEDSLGIALRYKRLYKDYRITLNDVQKNDYKGTNNPKDYSSFIVVEDPTRDTKFEQRIWMNNPLRYAGETFYQSSYIPPGAVGQGSPEMTVLQVVTNEGWMTPYVACMIVGVGMLAQFGLTLLRFLNRRARLSAAMEPNGAIESLNGDNEALAATSAVDPHRAGSGGARRLDQWGWIVAGVVVVLVAAAVGRSAMPPTPDDGEMDVVAFGELPMWYKGRPMPLDTFARNCLLQLGDRASFKDEEGESQPAIRWLLDLMADEDKARKHNVIRIENLAVLDAVGLEKRDKFAYSLEELMEKSDEIVKQAMAASEVPGEQRTLYQRKVLELANRIIFYSYLERSLGRPPKMPPAGDSGAEPQSMQQLAQRAQDFFSLIEFARSETEKFGEAYELGPLPLVVPTHVGVEEETGVASLDTEWEPLSIARIYRQFYDEFPKDTPPAIDELCGVLDAARDGDVKAFNSGVAEYRDLLASHASDLTDLSLAKTDFEAFYNRFSAFNTASWLYLVAGILAVIGWLGWPQIFERTSFWLTLAILLLHTFALVGRVYISGRPPVTNLYSSAVFIGWAAVIGGLLMEANSKLGIGNVIAAAAGFLTLRIASGLAADGDTFVVLEAVLDTQFWLATHVVCISLGYATTYLAGLLGVLYILMGVFTPALSKHMSKEIARMTYGTLCFAIFFSFVGTVLGGLWADDSWGRFWGWDPKENGALIIVLWNALVLHARWGAMIKDRGLAVLTVLGNIVVSWSWFGVNELGVGLHSYGFTEGRLLMLVLFGASQLLIAGIGTLPKTVWLSERKQLAA
ncbi:Protein NrfI [Durusdinium trenchii]|uniref:Protein NrfI n=1 Tax=Durusdinium trenchii TaxID=1381693 RepID=A0ABP0RP27_9DINO